MKIFFESEKTYCIFIQRTVHYRSSDLVTCPNLAAHFPAPHKRLTQRFKPIIVTTCRLIIGCTEVFKGRKYEIFCRTIFPVSKEDQGVKQVFSSCKMRRIERRGNLCNDGRVVQNVIGGDLYFRESGSLSQRTRFQHTLLLSICLTHLVTSYSRSLSESDLDLSLLSGILKNQPGNRTWPNHCGSSFGVFVPKQKCREGR